MVLPPGNAMARQIVVRLKVDVAVPLFQHAWGPDASKVEQDSATEIVAFLKQRFPYWNFDVANSSAFSGLALHVTEQPANVVNFVLQREDARGSERLWQAVWFPPGDLSLLGAPPIDGATARLVGDFRGKFDSDTAAHDAVLAWLTKRVPVAAVGARFGSAEAGSRRPIVSPLPWRDFADLQISEFHIDGQRPSDSAYVKLIATGLGTHALYSDPSAGPSYEAVTLVPTRAQSPGGSEKEIDDSSIDEIYRLNLGALYLDRYVPFEPSDNFETVPSQ